ncbi:TPA: hypothetical protein ACS7XC_003667 [Providencia alcalifaciens]|uniref:hypothetical protein n=1 Tax=Providencia alcalifaciens TaxID=126385 RepID=UPI0015CFB135|nr:hypothetical protein [Providencia alcalifaciens]MBF0693386.1 hypothetical protein [Providencia alcalifaciens]NYS91890.1 hypothetical protein [Providencia alcalifaciens]
MNKLLVFLALLTCAFTANSNTVYTADELEEMIISEAYPKTLQSRLISDSTGAGSFDECVSMMKGIIDKAEDYPSLVERNSFGVFRAKLWDSDGLYELNCVEANDSVIAEQYKAEYK